MRLSEWGCMFRSDVTDLPSQGVGKTTMILDAMRRVDADGIAICEAHEDLEVFRLRLGKVLLRVIRSWNNTVSQSARR